MRAAVFVVLPLLLAALAAAEERPNIVLILADDLGVEGLGCYGGTSYSTPRLDRLAAEGRRYVNAYAQPFCTNTRIQLMTGVYNHRNWVAFGILDPNAKTIGHWMQEAGYATCIAGKWQLQSYDPPDYPGAETRRGIGMQPWDAGFDAHSLWHTGHTELKGSRYADPVILENGTFRDDTQGRYGEDLWVEFIRDFMARHRDRPFFVYYAMTLPHWPVMPTPDSPDWADPAKRQIEDPKYFPDMVAYLDKCVGSVVDAVDSLGLGEKTLILFYSDNGTNQSVTSQTVDGPVTGGKGLTTDAGTHVPLIARWTGRVQPGLSGDLVDSTDFLPTLLEAAGRPLPRTVFTDGVSFYPRLTGKPGTPREWVFCHFDPRPGWDKDKFMLERFARDTRFKLYDDGRLFDVPADRLEENPILPTRDTPESAAARKRLQAVLEAMAAGRKAEEAD